MAIRLLLLSILAIAWSGSVGAFVLSTPPFDDGLLPHCDSRSGVSSLYMAMKVNLRVVGRKGSSEDWIKTACSMYESRLRPTPVQVDTTYHKNNDSLIKGVETDQSKGHSLVLLDPAGAARTSEKFARDLFLWLEQGGSRLTFVIGAAEGLPAELTTVAPNAKLLSLSSMTLTHQFARLLLLEQIYRATEIRKGTGYHK